MLATAREPQANVTAMPVTPFQQEISIPGSFGAEIVPKTNIPDTQRVLNLIMLKSLQNVNPSTEEELNGFLRYMRDVRQVAVVDTHQGSLIITVECSSLDILEGLWEDYRTGHLNDVAQTYLVTEDILKELGLIEVKLITTILEDEYRACREYFLQKPGEDERMLHISLSFSPGLLLFSPSFLQTKLRSCARILFVIVANYKASGNVLLISYDRVPYQFVSLRKQP